MRRVVALIIGVLAIVWLSGSPAGASTLADCLTAHHVCVTSEGRSLISSSQQDQLEQEIGNGDIYLVAGVSGQGGYDAAMDQVISTLGAERQQFVVGYLDTQLEHFGAYNQGVLPSGAAATIATTVVQQHHSGQGIFAALQDFVRDAQAASAASGTSATSASPPSHTLRNSLIALVIILVVAGGGFLFWRPRRMRRQRELGEAKAAAQDDLIALSSKITDHQNDVSVQGNQEAAAEQAAALAAYERGTTALDAARRPEDMRAVSRAIAEGQYRLACAQALANGQPKPGRRPMCFFDPRHGMSVADVSWAPPDGGPSREVPRLRRLRAQDRAGSSAGHANGAGQFRLPGRVCQLWFRPGVLGRFRVRRRHAHRLPARRGACLTTDHRERRYGYGEPGYAGDGDQFGGGNFGGDRGDAGGTSAADDFNGGDFGGETASAAETSDPPRLLAGPASDRLRSPQLTLATARPTPGHAAYRAPGSACCSCLRSRVPH